MKERKKPSSKERNPGGRPEFQPKPDDRTLVEALAGYGIPHVEIAKLVINPQTNEPITDVTLRKHFRRELDKGQVSASSRVIGGLFKNAITPIPGRYPGGIPVAQIFWLKTRERWRTTDGPQVVVNQNNTPELTDMQEVARRMLFAIELAAKNPPIEGKAKKVDA